jgi:hypothetical protein
MLGADRVALVGVIWFAFWTIVGMIIGRVLDTPGTWTIAGFVFGLVTVFTWPWVLPRRLDDWMHS